MYLAENPVLQRELLINLRTRRAFVLLFGYLALLGGVVLVAWPTERVDLSNPESSRRLVDLFFLGQYVLASLMAPSFAAGSITGEKERQTYEMLLASPLRPGAILLGKLLASLCHLAILIFSSLPIVLLCLPLGGTSFYEALASYAMLIMSIVTFGMISIACSSFFRRTAAALVVSYLLILPLALLGAMYWSAGELGAQRLLLSFTLLPLLTATIIIWLFVVTQRRLLHPPDVGSEGKDVIDEETEMREAVGLVIQRDRFPDRLFAPPKRDDLMEDDINPMYDKEMRSELFSQGTLMLRVVIQVSMLLAIPLMGVFLYFTPIRAPWYMAYVVVFNLLVGPVFSAGTVTGERERQTLELLLTTVLSPGQILWGKLLSGLRVSTVLTCFLLWPVVLAGAMVTAYWPTWSSLLWYVGIILTTCLTTAVVAMFCSVLFEKTSMSLMTAYLVLIVLFALPLAVGNFARTYLPDTPAPEIAMALESTSPFAAIFAVPLYPSQESIDPRAGSWSLVIAYFAFSAVLITSLLVAMRWLFTTRWRVAF